LYFKIRFEINPHGSCAEKEVFRYGSNAVGAERV
jgi:hypothetical protein